MYEGLAADLLTIIQLLQRIAARLDEGVPVEMDFDDE